MCATNSQHTAPRRTQTYTSHAHAQLCIATNKRAHSLAGACYNKPRCLATLRQFCAVVSVGSDPVPRRRCRPGVCQPRLDQKSRPTMCVCREVSTVNITNCCGYLIIQITGNRHVTSHLIYYNHHYRQTIWNCGPTDHRQMPSFPTMIDAPPSSVRLTRNHTTLLVNNFP